MQGKVLLIEDEPNIIEAIRFILSRDGWQVETHGDGADAVEVVRRVAPDVLVLDVMLPGRSGFDILHDLRGAAETNDLPVLMLTARSQARDRDMAMAGGASRFLAKPFANTEVLNAVRDLASARTAGG